MIDAASILAQFRTAAEARGLRLPDRLDADGKLHRCELQAGPKGKQDGAYLLHLDGVPAGGFQNFRDGLDWENWRADIGRQLTPEEEAAGFPKRPVARPGHEAELKKRTLTNLYNQRPAWLANSPGSPPTSPATTSA